MTVKDFFENFEDKGGSIIRVVADNGNFDMRIGYNYIDKNHSIWRNFIAMYGDYIVTEWYAGEDNPYTVITIYITEDKGEGKFDYNVVYTIKGWDEEVRSLHMVHKSQLADVIEDAFENGGYDIKIGCVDRRDRTEK